jgi:hypothetical protein
VELNDRSSSVNRVVFGVLLLIALIVVGGGGLLWLV